MKPRISKSGKYWLCKCANTGFLAETPCLAYYKWRRFSIAFLGQSILSAVRT